MSRFEFGDIVENGWASEGNPRRMGIYLRSFHRSGRLNPGHHVELQHVDGKRSEFLIADDDKLTKVGTIFDDLTEERDRLREALTWRPISTADKDAIRLTLGIVRKGVLEEIHIGGYRYAINDDEESCWWSDQCDDEIVPTHWMAAPPPVEESKP